MRNLYIWLTLAIAATSSHSSSAALRLLSPACVKLIDQVVMPFAEFTEGQGYLVHVPGEAVLRTLRLVKIHAEAGLLDFVPADENGKAVSNLLFTQAKSQISTYPLIPAHLFQTRRLPDVKDMIFRHKVSSALIIPLRKPRFEGKGVKIFNAKDAAPEVVAASEELVGKLETFNQHLNQTGWNFTPDTHVHITPKQLGSSSAGTRLRPPVWNPLKPFSPAVAPLFVRSQLLDKPGGSTSPLYLQARAMLFTNYSDNAYVNQSPLGNAVANFLVADHTGDPHHASPWKNNGLDMAKRARLEEDIFNEGAMKVLPITSLVEFTSSTVAPVYYSNVLWRLRETLGSEAALRISKATIELCNQSWTNFKRDEYYKNSSELNQYLQEFFFFLANLNYYADTNGRPEISKIIYDTIRELKMPARLVMYLQASLKFDKKEWKPGLISERMRLHVATYRRALTVPTILSAAAGIIGYYLWLESSEDDEPATSENPQP